MRSGRARRGGLGKTVAQVVEKQYELTNAEGFQVVKNKKNNKKKKIKVAKNTKHKKKTTPIGTTKKKKKNKKEKNIQNHGRVVGRSSLDSSSSRRNCLTDYPRSTSCGSNQDGVRRRKGSSTARKKRDRVTRPGALSRRAEEKSRRAGGGYRAG